MIDTNVNWLAVFVSAIVAYMLGWAWYSQKAFGKEWMELVGMNDKSKKKDKNEGMAKVLLLGFLWTLVASFTTANFVRMSGSSNLGEGFQLGFWIWIGFIVPITIGSILYEKKPSRLWMINNGYNALMFILMAVILSVWG